MKRVLKNISEKQSKPALQSDIDSRPIQASDDARSLRRVTDTGELLDVDDPLLRQPGSVSYWEYAQLLKDPKTTIEEASAWLRERSCFGTQADVTRHRKSFAVILETARQTAFVSVALVTASRDLGRTKIAEACAVLVEQKLLQSIYKRLSAPESHELEPKAWKELLAAVNLLLGNRLKVQTIVRAAKRKANPGKKAEADALTPCELAKRFNAVLLVPREAGGASSKGSSADGLSLEN